MSENISLSTSQIRIILRMIDKETREVNEVLSQQDTMLFRDIVSGYQEDLRILRKKLNGEY